VYTVKPDAMQQFGFMVNLALSADMFELHPN
jgi:hypothetical protein